MSSGQELEIYRSRIAAARAIHVEGAHRQFPPVPELPEGLFNRRQLERWQEAQRLINATVPDFFEKLGGTKYVLEPDFGYALRSPGSKQVDFSLKFREEESEGEWIEETPYLQVRFYYDAGGRLTPESIGAYAVDLIVPKEEKYRGLFDVEEVIRWINDPATDSYHYHVARVNSLKITRESIENLLKLLLANPKVIQPSTGNLVPR